MKKPGHSFGSPSVCFTVATGHWPRTQDPPHRERGNEPGNEASRTLTISHCNLTGS